MDLLSEAAAVEDISVTKTGGTCDTCAYLVYDDDYEEYVCDVNMDEDDYVRLMSDRFRSCPYYCNGDEYRIARKQ